MRLIVTLSLLAGCIAFAPQLSAADVVFERLGQPFSPRPLKIEVVTTDSLGHATAWSIREDAEALELIGVETATGHARTIDLERFGRSHVRMIRAANGNLYLYMGNPGRFIRIDADDGSLRDLGVPGRPARYHVGHEVGPDGVFYVGSYPATQLVALDPATESIRSYGPIAEDEREKYLLTPAVDGSNRTIYAPVGLHHAELWSVDLATGAKRQILDEELMANQGSVKVYRAIDGEVYGVGFGRQWRCHPDRIEYVEQAPAAMAPVVMNDFGGQIAVQVDGDGRLELHGPGDGEVRHVATDITGISTLIFSVGSEHEGKIYGGGFQPSNSFTYDLATGSFEDLGKLVRGNIQVYDTVVHPRGLFMSSYTGGHLDFHDFATGRSQHLASLTRLCGQERPSQLVLAPDGMIYVVTTPVKGFLEGAIARIDPESLEVSYWAGIVADQCFTSVAPIPETGELLVTGSIRGGTSSIPKAAEASIILWDPRREQVVWKAELIGGTSVYRKAVRAANGLVYIVTDERKYLALDPVAREVVFTGELPPSGAPRPIGLRVVDDAAGPGGLIYGLVDDAVFAIDPADHSCRIVGRHPSIGRKFEGALHGTIAEWAAPDGRLYYGSGSELWRMTISSEE